jgi:hypothetical protein
MLKKLIYKLQLFDGVWSVPLSVFFFLIVGKFSYEYFGDTPLISTEYLQLVMLAAVILIFANFVVFLGIRFNFRTLQKDFYSKELRHYASMELKSWQKIKLYLFVYFGFLVSFLLILWLVMTATA